MDRAEAFANLKQMLAEHRRLTELTEKLSPERAPAALAQDIRALGGLVEAVVLTVEKFG